MAKNISYMQKQSCLAKEATYANAVNGYQMVNRADVGGKYQGTWQTATASWVTIIRRLWNTPTLPKTGY